MRYEKETIKKEDITDAVFVLKNGAAVKVDVPDDDSEEAPNVDYD